jgi:hypothetical protein
VALVILDHMSVGGSFNPSATWSVDVAICEFFSTWLFGWKESINNLLPGMAFMIIDDCR